MLVQGPPATGKTYIGEHVVKTMLKLKEKFGFPEGPIMLTCQTNHALDQFLRKLLEYTKKLVRLGSRSQDKMFKQFQIREMGKELGLPFPKKYGSQKRKHKGMLTQFRRHSDSYNTIFKVPVFVEELEESADLQKEPKQQLKQLFARIRQDFENVCNNFLDGFSWAEANKIEKFFNKTLRKLFVCPEMYFWLGILTMEKMYTLYQIDWIKKLTKAAAKEDGTWNQKKREEAKPERTDEYMEKYEEIANSPKEHKRIAEILVMELPDDIQFETYSETY